MVRVYNWMGAAGLGITGFMAYYIANSPAIFNVLMGNPILPIVLIVAQIGLVFWLASRVMQMSVSQATGVFLLYAGLTGHHLFDLVRRLYRFVHHLAIYGDARNFRGDEFLWLHYK